MLSRAFDALVSVILLLLASPLMVVIAVAIRCDSPGPAIFTQLAASVEHEVVVTVVAVRR
jgi:lipopolysaccharide/colanic/teichoic acid biosynthesis glycosyltransferase